MDRRQKTDGTHREEQLGSSLNKMAFSFMGTNTAGNLNQLDPTGNTDVSALLHLPDDYVEGTDIDFTVRLKANASGNVAVIDRYMYRYRDGAAQTTPESATNFNWTVPDTNTHDRTYTLSETNFNAGDTLFFYMQRRGSDGADTNTGLIQVLEIVATYTKN